MKSRQSSAACTSTSALAPASRAPCTASPGRSSAFDGMHAQYEHRPPTRSRSTTATRRPPSAMAAAQCSPGAPPPRTMTSYWVLTTGAPRPPARGPCRARTSPASSDPRHRFASRAHHARRRRAAARRPARLAEANDVSAGSTRPGSRVGDFLEQPAVAVRITERGERAIAAVVGRRAADAIVRAGRMEPRAECPLVEDLADLDAPGEEPVAGGLDVGDDQVQPLGRAGRGGGQVRPELDRAPGPGGVNWIRRNSSPAATSASSRQPRRP